MTHDARVEQQPLHVALVKAGDGPCFKVCKSLPKVFTPVQNGEPAQPGLKTFQTNLFKQPALVRDGKARFGVVVAAAVVCCGLAPGAADGEGVVGEKTGDC